MDLLLNLSIKSNNLGVYFVRNSGHTDISQSFVKFFSQFNNIMAVLGKHQGRLHHINDGANAPWKK